MDDKYKISDSLGCEIRSIETDEKGHYLGDLVDDKPQGSKLTGIGTLKGRPSKSDFTPITIVKVKSSTTQQVGGVNEACLKKL